MSTWKKEMFCEGIAQTVKSEYRKLLSVKKSNQEAAEIIIGYCMDKLISRNAQEGQMWMALAPQEDKALYIDAYELRIQ